MPILTVLKYPDPLLRQSTFEVENLSEDIRQLVQDLELTMFSLEALGISAIQVGRRERVFIIDGRVGSNSDLAESLIFINPEILEYGKNLALEKEGCLSFPETFINVQRSFFVKVRAMNLIGEIFELEAEGLLARVIQHEYDHLQGNLMIDKANFFEQRRVERQFKK